MHNTNDPEQKYKLSAFSKTKNGKDQHNHSKKNIETNIRFVS